MADIAQTSLEFSLRDKYDQLTDGQKRLLIQKYIAHFDACIKTFFNKINGDTRVRPSEQKFFSDNL